jgi:hypothetical protein
LPSSMLGTRNESHKDSPLPSPQCLGTGTFCSQVTVKICYLPLARSIHL